MAWSMRQRRGGKPRSKLAMTHKGAEADHEAAGAGHAGVDEVVGEENARAAGNAADAKQDGEQ